MPRLKIMICNTDDELFDQFFVELNALNDIAASHMVRDCLEKRFEAADTLAELDEEKL